MNKIIKIVFIIIIVISALFFSVRYYINNGGKRDIQSEETAYTVSSLQIVDEFTSNITESNKKYLEKPVVISGTVTSIIGNEVIIDNVVNCEFAKVATTLKQGKKVVVKGRVIGFDDLLGELKLDQCNLQNNQ
ncbi:OB-fold protein [Flavobacterium sp. RSB2_4_14]|uniref:OB-fold protein n=1 Tax=Flavobacterium sp. RSB2_4_14 TaxID=3447665 RepID=UPI003F391416